jgi:hypothetical protein
VADWGGVPWDQVKELYRENLEKVLSSVETLVSELSGSTIITSDHGEILGESGRFGHPCQMDLRVLRSVPWDKR